MNPKKAILIAAGRGKRLGNHTDEIPKCLVEVGGQPMLAWQWRALAAAGIEDVVMIRGYRGDVLERGAQALGVPARFVDNSAWEHNNILLSLAQARHELDGPCFISYSDIIYTPAVARAAAACPHRFGLVIDRSFRDIYEGRTDHPLSEGEVASLRGDVVDRVGKRALPAEQAFGEFIGLMAVDATGAAMMRTAIETLLTQFAATPDAPFQRAARFVNAYLTDLLQDLIDGGQAMHSVTIDGAWREIDTNQDLTRAAELLSLRLEGWS